MREREGEVSAAGAGLAKGQTLGLRGSNSMNVQRPLALWAESAIAASRVGEAAEALASHVRLLNMSVNMSENHDMEVERANIEHGTLTANLLPAGWRVHS